MPLESLKLESLSEIPVLPRGAHVALMQKCLVCLDSQKFCKGSPIVVECVGFPGIAPRTGEAYFLIDWDVTVDDALKAAHADLVESVEDSAKAIGLLLITKLTPYTAGRQALRGTHIDYLLVDKTNEELPFQAETTAEVEFTGILEGIDKIGERTKNKRERLHAKRDFPVFIVCVEHSFPLALIERVEP
ncbi:MAG: hypothetical protein HDQ93_05290 [Desulfovibrio sp.]|nr:hypothetical protein [Desulfovibrio sp.]